MGPVAVTGVQQHWAQVYRARDPETVSWYQRKPTVSMALIRKTAIAFDDPIIDVGGGASRLVDALLDAGFTDLTVLDIAGDALEKSRQRLGERATDVEWIEQDVMQFEPQRRYALWHDRAMFHFLTEPEDRAAYKATLGASLRDDGHAIIATFAIDGPPRCSGLDVIRYDSIGLLDTIGPGFELLEQVDETHRTPAGAEQNFSFFMLRRTNGTDNSSTA